MAHTYDDTNLSADLDTTRDDLRFRIGDQEVCAASLSDGELDALLTKYTTVTAAAIPAIDRMIAKAARLVSGSSGGESEDYDTLYTNLQAQRRRLVDEGCTDHVETGTAAHVTLLRRTDDDGSEYTE